MKSIVHAAFCGALLFSTLVQAQGLSRAWSPEQVGFAPDRLARLGAALQEGVDKGEIPGAVVLIARQGRVAYFESFGYRDREAKAPMEKDAIFRIASMTKPIVSVAAMMLVEQGRIRLEAPVSLYLPEFRDVKVGVEKLDASGKAQLELEAPKRQMTVQDLMRHTSGLTYGFTGKSLVRDEYTKANLSEAGISNAEFVTRLARVPLQHQPGAVWDYSVSTDVLGRVVEVVSGMELERFVGEHILKPLRMPDTGFRVEAPAQIARIAEVQADAATGKRAAMPDVTRRFRQAGGGAMYSTAADYARFCQMLLSGGELDGVRLLSRRTVAYMASDHIPPGARVQAFTVPVLDARAENGQGFGLGFAVRVSAGRSAVPGSVGDYSWTGIYGTQFWVDPKEEMFAILMFQVPPGPAGNPARGRYWTFMRNFTYAALVN